MSDSGVKFKADWLNLIDRLPGEVSRAKLAYAVLNRLIRGAPTPLANSQQWVYALIEREILVSERQRRNGEKKWRPSPSGIMPRTMPRTMRGIKVGTMPTPMPPPMPNAEIQGARPHEEPPQPSPVAAAPEPPAPAHHPSERAPASNTAPARGECLNPVKEKEKNKRVERERNTLKGKKKETPESVPIPEVLDSPEFRETWAAWIQCRRDRRKPMTALAARMQLKLMARYAPTEAVSMLQESMKNDWQGVFPPKGRPREAVRKKDYTGI